MNKGPHKNDVGTITQLIGNGRARRWRVLVQIEREIGLHSQSLAVDAIIDSISEENLK